MPSPLSSSKSAMVRALAGVFDTSDQYPDLTGVPPAAESAAPLDRGEKSIPWKKRRYYANAEKRALSRWDGAQKMLRLLEPSGVRHDARAMDVLSRKYGI